MGAESLTVELVLQAIDMATAPVRHVQGALRGLVGLGVAGAGKLSSVLSAAGGKAIQFGRQVTVGAGVAGASLVALATPHAELDKELRVLSTVASGTQGEIESSLNSTREAALAWQRQMGESASEFVRSNYLMASAGLSNTAALEGTKQAVRLAKAALDDQVPTANLLASVYTNLGNKSVGAADEMDRLSNMLLKTQQMFKLANLSQLGTGISNAIGPAKAAGVEIQELLTLLGALNTAGVEGGRAGTALKATMDQMIPASRKLGFEIARTSTGGLDLIGTFLNIEKKFGSFNQMSDRTRLKLQKAFGTEGQLPLQLFLGQLGPLIRQMGQVERSSGTLGATLDKLGKGPAADAAKLKGAWMDVRMTLGQLLMPALIAVGRELKRVIEWVSAFIKQNPEIAKWVGTVTVLATAFAAVAGPVIMVVGVILKLGAALALAAKWVGMLAMGVLRLSGFLGGVLMAGLRAVLPVIGGLVTGVIALAKGLVTAGIAAGKAALAFIATPFGALVAGFMAVGAAIGWVASKWRDLTGESNNYTEVSKDYADRLKNNKAFREQQVRMAMEGGKRGGGVRRVLNKVLGDQGFDDQFWQEVDRQKELKKRGQLRAQYGLAPTIEDMQVSGPGGGIQLRGQALEAKLNQGAADQQGGRESFADMQRTLAAQMEEQKASNRLLRQIANQGPPKVVVNAGTSDGQDVDDEGDL